MSSATRNWRRRRPMFAAGDIRGRQLEQQSRAHCLASQLELSSCILDFFFQRVPFWIWRPAKRKRLISLFGAAQNTATAKTPGHERRPLILLKLPQNCALSGCRYTPVASSKPSRKSRSKTSLIAALILSTSGRWSLQAHFWLILSS